VTATIRKAPVVFDDLDGIAAFIGLDNPIAALRFLDFLEEKFSLLAASPGIGRLFPELDDDLRGFPAKDYWIFYRQTGDGIDIIRVLHGARDMAAIFQDTELEG
jgi:toxin ParE1/3/4